MGLLFLAVIAACFIHAGAVRQSMVSEFAAQPLPTACFVELQRARLPDGYRKSLRVAQERFLLWLVTQGLPGFTSLLEDTKLLNKLLIQHVQYLYENQLG